MTLTIDFDPAEEARLNAAAHQEGVAPVALLKRIVNGLPAVQGQNGTGLTQEQARIAAIRAARGSMAYVGVMTADLHRERQSDKQSEERLSAEHRF